MNEFTNGQSEISSSLKPSPVAAVVGQEEITYSTLMSDIRAAEIWLSEHLQPGEERIAVSLRHSYWNWIFSLALLQMGKACASIPRPTTLAPVQGERFHLCLSDAPVRAEGKVLQVSIGQIRELGRKVADEPPASEQTRGRLRLKLRARSQRLLLTSGTTGRPKMVCLSARDIRDRLNVAGRQYGADISAQTQTLTLMGLDTIGGFLITLLTWLHGGIVLFGRPSDKSEGDTDIPLERSTLLSASPVKLKMLLDMTTGVFPGRERRIVRVGGARLHPSTRDDALRRLGCRLQTTYGATELGLVASCDAAILDRYPGAAGHVLPAVEVQIVDVNDLPVPWGKPGIVRCKTPGMAKGYVGDADSPQFRQGWFYPGDVGALTEDGMLIITGRISDVLNLGGEKLSAVDLETRFLHMEGLKDVCIVPLNDAHGLVLGVAVVHDDNVDSMSIRSRAEKILPRSVPRYLVRITEVPRNAMGKALRGQVARQLEDFLKQEASGR